MESITPEYERYPKPDKISVKITQEDLNKTRSELIDEDLEIDFVSIGCPHASIHEIAKIANLLKGKKVIKEFWITTARPTKRIADEVGYSKIIENARDTISKSWKWHPILYEVGTFARKLKKYPPGKPPDAEVLSLLMKKMEGFAIL